jgi:DNA topoisomerase I
MKLRKVTDLAKGLSRRKRGRGFSYTDSDGNAVACAVQRARLDALGIPPAWQQVWICPFKNGHIQATGLDEAGRKQYIYHPVWQAARAEQKYDRLADFGKALPGLRRKVSADLLSPPGSQDFAMAALVSVIDHASLRIGSARYTKRNGSYGATTLLRRHVRDLGAGRIELRFKAKGGKRVRRRLHDARLHKAIEQLSDLPGATLFTWVDDTGAPRAVSSQLVNSYLGTVCATPDVTAKTFRTWSGSVAALDALRRIGPDASIKSLCDHGARVLHNTPAICRKSYVHPAIFDLAALPVSEREAILGPRAPDGPRGLRAEERRLMKLLDAWSDAG